MKKNLRIISAGMACVLAASALTACKKDAETDADGKIVVTMWSHVTSDSKQTAIDAENRMLEKVAEKFPDYKLELIKQPHSTDYRQDYDKALMAGNAPDIFSEFSYTDIPTRISNGTIADITSLVTEWDMKKEDRVLTTFDDAISKDGKWYAIPLSAYTEAMIVNKKVLEAGGVDSSKLPTTWDEFAQAASQITDFNIPRIGYELVGMDWCAWPFTAWVWSAGGEMVTKNSDDTYKISFNSDAGVDAAVFLNEMIWKHKATQKNVLCSIEDINGDLRNGTAGFAWATYSDALTQDSMEKFGLSYDDFTMTPMPVKDSSIVNPSLAGGEVITFNPKADEATLKAAFEIAAYIYYDEEYLVDSWERTFAEGTCDIKIPGRQDLYEKKLEMNYLLSDESKEGLEKMRANAIAEPYCPHWSDVKSQLVKPLQEIYLTEGITREQVQKLLDDCASELYKLYPDTFKQQ